MIEINILKFIAAGLETIGFTVLAVVVIGCLFRIIELLEKRIK